MNRECGHICPINAQIFVRRAAEWLATWPHLTPPTRRRCLDALKNEVCREEGCEEPCELAAEFRGCAS